MYTVTHTKEALWEQKLTHPTKNSHRAPDFLGKLLALPWVPQLHALALRRVATVMQSRFLTV